MGGRIGYCGVEVVTALRVEGGAVLARRRTGEKWRLAEVWNYFGIFPEYP